MKDNKDTLEVVVRRAFFLPGGIPAARGSRHVLPLPTALRLIDCGKARRLNPEELEPLAPESAQAPVADTPESRGRRRAGSARTEEA